MSFYYSILFDIFFYDTIDFQSNKFKILFIFYMFYIKCQLKYNNFRYILNIKKLKIY